MSQNENLFTGVLESDSPALFGILRRNFPPEAVTDISKCYRLANKFGANNNDLSGRTSGSSFNPRSARICQILIQEAEEKDLLTLRASLFAPISESEKLQLDDSALSAVVQAVYNLCTTQNFSGIDERVERIFLAFILDLLRHAHLVEIPGEVNRTLIDEVKNNIVSRMRYHRGHRLSTLIEACLERLERQAART